VSKLFDPPQLRDLTLANRLVIPPMCMYQAEPDGSATDWHLAHYGALAFGGAASVILEATAVEARGRISHADLGIPPSRLAELPQLRAI
jgi:NADPH2 dehydrogenase